MCAAAGPCPNCAQRSTTTRNRPVCPQGGRHHHHPIRPRPQQRFLRLLARHAAVLRPKKRLRVVQRRLHAVWCTCAGAAPGRGPCTQVCDGGRCSRSSRSRHWTHTSAAVPSMACPSPLRLCPLPFRSATWIRLADGSQHFQQPAPVRCWAGRTSCGGTTGRSVACVGTWGMHRPACLSPPCLRRFRAHSSSTPVLRTRAAATARWARRRAWHCEAGATLQPCWLRWLRWACCWWPLPPRQGPQRAMHGSSGASAAAGCAWRLPTSTRTLAPRPANFAAPCSTSKAPALTQPRTRPMRARANA